MKTNELILTGGRFELDKKNTLGVRIMFVDQYRLVDVWIVYGQGCGSWPAVWHSLEIMTSRRLQPL